jgi:hypothetical protein
MDSAGGGGQGNGQIRHAVNGGFGTLAVVFIIVRLHFLQFFRGHIQLQFDLIFQIEEHFVNLLFRDVLGLPGGAGGLEGAACEQAEAQKKHCDSFHIYTFFMGFVERYNKNISLFPVMRNIKRSLFKAPVTEIPL